MLQTLEEFLEGLLQLWQLSSYFMHAVYFTCSSIIQENYKPSVSGQHLVAKQLTAVNYLLFLCFQLSMNKN